MSKPVICEGCGLGPCHYGDKGRTSLKWGGCAVPKGEGLSMQDRAFEGGNGPGYQTLSNRDVLGRARR